MFGSFGMVDISHTPALGYMEVVGKRDAATLLTVQHLHPGTVVHSDEWAAYRHVQQLPYRTQHCTVNHPVTFIDPTTGTHTLQWANLWAGLHMASSLVSLTSLFR